MEDATSIEGLAERLRKVFCSLKLFVTDCSSAEHAIQIQLDNLDQDSEVAGENVTQGFRALGISLEPCRESLLRANSIKDAMRVEIIARLLFSTLGSITASTSQSLAGLSHLEKMEKLTQDDEHFKEEIDGYGYAGISLSRMGSIQIVMTELVESGELALKKLDLLQPFLSSCDENIRKWFVLHYYRSHECFQKNGLYAGRVHLALPWIEATLRVATFDWDYQKRTSIAGLSNHEAELRDWKQWIAKTMHYNLSRMYLSISSYEEAARHFHLSAQLCDDSTDTVREKLFEMLSQYYLSNYAAALEVLEELLLQPLIHSNLYSKAQAAFTKFTSDDLSGFNFEDFMPSSGQDGKLGEAGQVSNVESARPLSVIRRSIVGELNFVEACVKRLKKIFVQMRVFVKGCSSAENAIQSQLDRLENGKPARRIVTESLSVLLKSMGACSENLRADKSIEDALRVEIVMRLMLSVMISVRRNFPDQLKTLALAYLERVERFIEDQDHFHDEMAGFGYAGVTLTKMSSIQVATSELLSSGKLALEKFYLLGKLYGDELDQLSGHFFELGHCAFNMEMYENTIQWYEAALIVATSGWIYERPISNLDVHSETELKGWQEVADKVKVIHRDLGLIHQRSSNYEEASKHFKFSAQLHDDGAEKGDIIMREMNSLYMLGDHVRVMEIVEELLLQPQIDSDLSMRFRAQTLFFKGAIEVDKGDTGDSIRSLEEARKIYEEIALLDTPDPYVATTHSVLLRAYLNNESYWAASRLEENFGPIVDKYHSGSSFWQLWKAYKADIHLHVQDFERAEEVLKQVIPHTTTPHDPFDTLSRSARAFVECFQVQLDFHEGLIQSGMERFDKAMELSAATPALPFPMKTIQAIQHLIQDRKLDYREGNASSLEGHYSKVQELLVFLRKDSSSSNKLVLGGILDSLARTVCAMCLHNVGNHTPSEVIELADECIQLMDQPGDRVYRALFKFNKANLLLFLDYNLSMAEAEGRDAALLFAELQLQLRDIETAWVSLFGHDMKLTFNFMQFLLLCVFQNPRKALLWAERGRMRHFLYVTSVLRDANVNSVKKHAVSNLKTDEVSRIDPWELGVGRANLASCGFGDLWFDKEDEFAETFLVNTVAKCVPGSLIIEYTLGEGLLDQKVLMIYIIVIDPEGRITVQGLWMDVTNLQKTFQEKREYQKKKWLWGTTLTSLISKTRRFIVSKKDKDAMEGLSLLHSLLIQPVEEILNGYPRLIVAVHEQLMKVPFAALYNKRSKKFLVQEKIISYIPSICVLQHCLSQQQQYQQNMQRELLGPPFIAGNPEPMGEGWDQLPGAAEEAKLVAETLGVLPCIGRDMNKRAVKDGLSNASIVHLATHGVVSIAYPHGALILQGRDNSKLRNQDDRFFTIDSLDHILTKSLHLGSEGPHLRCQRNPSNNSLIHQGGDAVIIAQELASLKGGIKCGLVVLSACRSGEGEVTSEGMLGLGRALLQGGAATAILAMWEIMDSSTKVLIHGFFEKLVKEGKDVAEALQATMLQMLDNELNEGSNYSIVHWASLIVLGSPHFKYIHNIHLAEDTATALSIKELFLPSLFLPWCHETTQEVGKMPNPEYSIASSLTSESFAAHETSQEVGKMPNPEYSIVSSPTSESFPAHETSQELDRKPQAEYSIASESLSIAWGKDDRFWKRVDRDGARFGQAAYLIGVCWLDVKGQLNTRTLKPGRYTLTWRLQVACLEGYPQPSGWEVKPVIFEVSTSDGQHMEQPVFLTATGNAWSTVAGTSALPNGYGETRTYGWQEYSLGAFTVDEKDGPVELTYSMREVSDHWKCGLFLDEVFILTCHEASQEVGKMPKTKYSIASSLTSESYAAHETSQEVGKMPEPQYSIRSSPTSESFPAHETSQEDNKMPQAEYSIASEFLSIAWGKDDRFWKQADRDGARFGQAAYLIGVCWLDVKGQLNTRTLKPGRYTLTWRLQVACLKGYPQPSGWDVKPVIFEVSISDGRHMEQPVFLTATGNAWSTVAGTSALPNGYGETRTYGWQEYSLGAFTVDEKDGPVELTYSMREVSDHWKCGLFLDGVFILPSHETLQEVGKMPEAKYSIASSLTSESFAAQDISQEVGKMPELQYRIRPSPTSKSFPVHETSQGDDKMPQAEYSIASEFLSIAWGKDDRFWKQADRDGARFGQAAYLIGVCWLDVKGQLNTRTLKPGRYTLTWRLQVACLKGYPQPSGWEVKPVIFEVSTSDGQHMEQPVFLTATGNAWSTVAGTSALPNGYGETRTYGWQEYSLGAFTVDEKDGPVELTYSMREVSDHWKCGLFLDGVFILPSHETLQEVGKMPEAKYSIASSLTSESFAAQDISQEVGKMPEPQYSIRSSPTSESFPAHETSQGDDKMPQAEYSIASEFLSIAWGKDDRFWKQADRDGARFGQAAYLIGVCWLDVKGQLNTRTLKPGRYTLTWRLQVACLEDYPQPSGWDVKPVIFEVSISDGRHMEQPVFLTASGNAWSTDAGTSAFPNGYGETYGWQEYSLGAFTVDEKDGPIELTYSMREVSDHWKCGLFLDGVFILPCLDSTFSDL